MASVNFMYRSTKDNSILVLRLLYRYDDKDYVYGAKTQLEVSKTYWSKEHKKTKNVSVELSNKQTEINKELNKIRGYVLNAFKSVNTNEVSKEWLKIQMDEYYNPKKDETLPTDLLEYFEYYIKKKKKSTTVGTQKKYNSTLRLLERYEKENRTRIKIIDINERFKDSFEEYCEDKDYAQNTISKFFKTIKAVCNHASYNGIEVSHQLIGFKKEQKVVDKIYLSFDEIEQIENIKDYKLTETLKNVRDWLIISCFTGQRVSDFMPFTADDIRVEDGNYFMEFTQIKGRKLTTIPLHPKVIEILEKRNGNFPNKISDQKYNDYIKIVCELAEINQLTKGSKQVKVTISENNKEVEVFRRKTGIYPKHELVTSHIGRRSLATNFYGKIPISYLINMTNHATETQFLAYVGKSSEDLAKETFKYFNK
jgi:integrase